MTNPFDDGDARYVLVVNELGDTALWPADHAVPGGWSRRHGPASRAECLREADASGRTRPVPLPPDPALRVHQLFEQQAAVTPDAVALLFAGTRLSYAELNDRANVFAHRLLARGVGRGDVVGVHLERGIELVVALLAVLKTGAGYALLDPHFPVARLDAALADSGSALVVCSPRLRGQLAAEPLVIEPPQAGEPAPGTVNPAVPGHPADTACVMYTSGSTGRPKGVAAPHRALLGTYAGQTYAKFGPGEVFLQCSPVSWDGFALELFGALLFGGACVLQPGQNPDPAAIEELVAVHAVTMLQLSSSLFNYLVDEHPAAFTGVRLVFTGGEVASAEHIARALGRFPGLRVGNGYGPVESMGFTTCHPVGPDDFTGEPVPIGNPVENKRLYLLDNRLEPVPDGETGEIYLAGAGLANGYLGQAARTAERFVPDVVRADGSRMYRTGDLGRRRPGGTLDFRGRGDLQVKIRGFRVEPGEVEAALAKHPDVGRVAVVVREDRPGARRLVAYVVGRAGAAPPRAGELRAHARKTLPEHMVPAGFTMLASLPLTANGKLDRAALRALPAAARNRRRPVA
ncbi:amino acid adenylation domain-containing protein [Amycolatopsis sp. OK19-0408]|uniref:Amino acid adenylation domain-containing protein n=1 Tax=Amycolatopsis iheyensis TaxID=2945988 RepID=A0A9X2NFA2_9PSEU|nr:amino acid adenylation domain-containing protein [Amycolatopsis iheyensis]MCR6485762.1 amino acid adenylation domain-containing protein [Amycolatopsis iheyensis]